VKLVVEGIMEVIFGEHIIHSGLAGNLSDYTYNLPNFA
jgi:hypothetical protein